MDSLKEFLNKHRRIKLYHNGKWYKYKFLNKVLGHSCNKSACGYCNRIKYVVKADDGVCFYVDFFEGCLTFSEDLEIHDFSDEAGLYEYMNRNKINIINNDSDNDSNSESF